MASRIFKTITQFQKSLQFNTNKLSKKFSIGDLKNEKTAVFSETVKTKTYDEDETEVNSKIIGNYSINYIKVGSGPHVVFCHPGILGNTKTHVVAQIRGFDREKFTFVTWDQPGYAKSIPLQGARSLSNDSFDEDVDLMVELMNKLDFKKYSVMGWSGGGCASLLAAIRYPDIVRKVVAWGAFSYVDEQDAENFKKLENPRNQSGKMMETLWKEYGENFFKIHFGKWMNLFYKIHADGNGEFFSRSLQKITCPTLILHGTKDGMVHHKHGIFLNENISCSRFVKWENGKHNLHLRYPDEFNKIVQNFLLEK